MNKMQEKLTETFSEFHNFCVSNNLKYYMIGGTLLGAVRHKGFIPWDDDIDVAMPREDYEKLGVLKDQLPTCLFLLEKGYGKETGTYAYKKIANTSTTLIENVNEYRIQGVYIDIFPIDGAGNTKLTSKFFYFINKFLIFLLWYNGSEISQKNTLKRIFRSLSKKLDNRKLYLAISKSLRRRPYQNYKYGGNFMGAYRFTEIVKASLYGIPTKYEFEGGEFFGPEFANEFLETIYGYNYLELPPKDKRVSHHNYEYLNMENSFFNYKKN